MQLFLCLRVLLFFALILEVFCLSWWLGLFLLFFFFLPLLFFLILLFWLFMNITWLADFTETKTNSRV